MIGPNRYTPVGFSRVTVGATVVYDIAGESGLQVTADPLSARGAQSFDGPVPVTTDSSTAAATGGAEPYTYAWSTDDLDTNWSIVSPNARTTAFRYASVPPGSSFQADFECTVTDARGRTGTVLVNAIVNNFGDPRGYQQIAP